MAFGALIGLAASAIGGAIQANSAKQAAGSLDTALDVRKQASRLGFSLDQVYGNDAPLDAPLGSVKKY